MASGCIERPRQIGDQNSVRRFFISVIFPKSGDASKGRSGQNWPELPAALEGTKRRLLRGLGNYFAFSKTRGLIKCETIVRFWLELEIVRLIQFLFPLYCSA